MYGNCVPSSIELFIINLEMYKHKMISGGKNRIVNKIVYCCYFYRCCFYYCRCCCSKLKILELAVYILKILPLEFWKKPVGWKFPSNCLWASLFPKFVSICVLCVHTFDCIANIALPYSHFGAPLLLYLDPYILYVKRNYHWSRAPGIKWLYAQELSPLLIHLTHYLV